MSADTDRLIEPLREILAEDGWVPGSVAMNKLGAVAAALAERDERLHRIHMFFENLSLRGILNIATEDALAEVEPPEEQKP